MSKKKCCSARGHLNAIHALREFLLHTCADRYDSQMDNVVTDLLVSFERYCRGDGATPKVTLYESSLGRNYITAQCARLLVFYHAVRQLACGQDLQPLAELLTRLSQDLSSTHQHFFAEPLPIPERS